MKSLSKSIIKSTFFVALTTNLITFFVIFFVFSNLISRTYKTTYDHSTEYISNFINEAINTQPFYAYLTSVDLEKISQNNIASLFKNKSDKNNGLTIYFMPNDDINLKKMTFIDSYIFKQLINKKEINHEVYNYMGKLFIVEKKLFGMYTYFQLFNITDSPILRHMYHLNGLIGFKYNGEFILFGSQEPGRFIRSVDSKIISPGIEFYYSNKGEVYYKIKLFISILVLLIFRFLVTLFSAKRNINKINSPLNKLVENTKQLATHQSEDILNITNYAYLEFKSLAEAFNLVLNSRKSSDLKVIKYMEQMESVVQKRTQELISSNNKLTESIKKAEEVNALKSQFLANISHEIRTPLNCIMGFCDIILTEDHGEHVSIQVKQILHESETLLHLINDLLDYTKIDAGKMKIVKAELDIRALIDSLMNSGQIQAREKNIKLISKIDNSVPPIIMADELRLYQVISNIFYNAIKFTPSGSVTIKISSSPIKENSEMLLTFYIIDTGIGIPDDRIKSIFNKFEQVDGSLTRKYRGSGLGLTICKSIIELMKGTIEVNSEINRGSCFKFTIPFEIKNKEVTDHNLISIVNDKSEDIKGKKILLVEDYPVNQIVAKKHLEMNNHEVTVAENGIEALGECKKTKFDLILMDLQMPVMDGFKATKRIRGTIGLNRKTPILAMTANAMDTAKQTCLECGMDGIITKPIRKKIFLNEVDRWI